jgi:hypothetical protein
MITVHVGDTLLSVSDPVDTLLDLVDVVGRRMPRVAAAHSFSVNGSLIVNGERFVVLSDGDDVEIFDS